MAGDMDRMADLLSSYYGVTAGDEEEDAAVAGAEDMDGPHFDAVSHAHEALREQPLPDLVAYEGKLSGEVKTLDGKMQNLVYQNYNKFISATDAVRRMKTSVESMEDEMGRLVETMEGMGGVSSKITTGLGENRAQIEKLVRVRRLLSRLEFLFDLPARLKRSIELDAFYQAVRYYRMASGVLEKQSSVPSLHAIHVEADSIMSGLRAKLRAKLDDDTLTRGKLNEACELLLELDENPKDVQKAAIGWHSRRLSMVLDAAATAQRTSEMGAAGGAADAVPAVDALTFVRRLNYEFLDHFVSASTNFSQQFEEGQDDVDMARSAHEAWVAVSKQLFTQYFAIIKRRLSVHSPVYETAETADEDEGKGDDEADQDVTGSEHSEQHSDGDADSTGDGEHSRSGKSDGARDSADEDNEEELGEEDANRALLFAGAGSSAKGRHNKGDAATKQAEQDAAPTGPYGPVVEALREIVAEVRSASVKYRDAQLNDRAAETVELVSRKQVDGAFVQLRKDVLEVLEQLADQSTEAAALDATLAGSAAAEQGLTGRRSKSHLAKVSLDASEAIVRRVDGVISATTPLVTGGKRLLPEMSFVFSELLRGQLHHFLLWFAETVEAIGDPDSRRTPDDSRRRGSASSARNTPASGQGEEARTIHVVSSGASRRRGSVVVRATGSGTFVAVLAAMSQTFCELGVSKLMSNLNEAVEDPAASPGELGALGAAADVPDLIKRARRTTRCMVGRYVSIRGERLVNMIRKSMDTADWSHMREPRDARMVVALLLDEIVSVRREVASVLDEAPEDLSAEGDAALQALRSAVESGAAESAGERKARGLHMDIERLFSTKATIYSVDGVEPQTDAVTLAVVSIMVKALGEFVRLCSFSRGGYQQMQVDISVIRLAVPYLVRNCRSVMDLLDEVEASAADRSLDPTPMEPSIVLEVASERFDKIQENW